jgi:hypothetical protein
MEDLKVVEGVVRKDPKVIKQCGIIGIPPEDMHKVYCDRRSLHEWPLVVPDIPNPYFENTALKISSNFLFWSEETLYSF